MIHILKLGKCSMVLCRDPFSVGPRLFNIYIRFLYTYVESTNFSIGGFADDQQLVKNLFLINRRYDDAVMKGIKRAHASGKRSPLLVVPETNTFKDVMMVCLLGKT